MQKTHTARVHGVCCGGPLLWERVVRQNKMTKKKKKDKTEEGSAERPGN